MTREGTLIDADTGLELRFERRLPQPVDRVWQAVTDPGEMAAWFPCAVEGDRAAGAELLFRFEGDAIPPDRGQVLEWDPPNAWAFDWSGYRVRIALDAAADGGTVLTFTQSLPDRSGAARQGAGWHTCLDALDAHVAGTAAPAGDDWRPLYTDYLERMGPSLGAITNQYRVSYARSHFVGADRLWECITDSKELTTWMDYPVEIEPKLGGRFFIDFTPDAQPVEGVVVACEEGRRLAFTFEELTVLEWTIEPDGTGCRYTFTHNGISDPDMAAQFGSGWHGFLVQLDMYAASGQLVADPDGHYEARIPEYRKLLDR